MEIIKRFFFFLCCFFIAINSVNADLLDNNEIYYTFDGDFNDTINSIDLTSNGDVSTSSSEFVIGDQHNLMEQEIFWITQQVLTL